ncbi:MAG: hypothetical protein NC122_10500, partial [Faecalibacterium sp.]|nr:hypothetical protein [Ruminococcus sp.]MCM1486619.1 hypothetical protein [Faecalibacterium sp.]
TSEVTKEATCSAEGVRTYTCKNCTASYTEAIAKTAHADGDKDGLCDACGATVEVSDPSENCDHICHKGGFTGFIYKIIRVFWKLFKINQTCECGVNHY